MLLQMSKSHIPNGTEYKSSMIFMLHITSLATDL